jgi:hypothetical protein
MLVFLIEVMKFYRLINNINIKIMNGSPFLSCAYKSDSYITPSRKPTQHNCNADKKQHPFTVIDEAVLAPISRNLFNDSGDRTRTCAPGVNAKLMR